MIEINNLTENKVDESFIKKMIKQVLKGEKVKEEPALSIAFLGPGRMRKLNKTYRKRNRVTDVLAFPESKVKFEKFKLGPTQKVKGLGEIVICLREVKKNARKFEATFEKELARVLIHGILHLLGYNHEKSDKEAKAMEEKEKKYLEIINY